MNVAERYPPNILNAGLALESGHIILALFVASAIYVHFGGKVRIDFSRHISVEAVSSYRVAR